MLYMAVWAVLAIVYAVFVEWSEGFRYDVSGKIKDPVFLFEVIVPALIGISAASASSYMMIPDMRGKKWLIPVTLTMVGLFLLWCILKWMTHEHFQIPPMKMGHCMQEGMFIAVVPLMVLIFVLRTGATTRPILMGLMNVLSVTSIGYIALRFNCSMDSFGHAALYHLMPYVLIGLLIGVAARKLYKW